MDRRADRPVCAWYPTICFCFLFLILIGKSSATSSPELNKLVSLSVQQILYVGMYKNYVSEFGYKNWQGQHLCIYARKLEGHFLNFFSVGAWSDLKMVTLKAWNTFLAWNTLTMIEIEMTKKQAKKGLKNAPEVASCLLILRSVLA